VLRDEEVELRGAHVHPGLRAVAARSPKDEQPPRLDPHDDREPLNVDIRTETSRRLGRYKADHRGTTKSAVADAAISEWLAKRNY
jgi:hypothetical protein